MSLAGDDVDAKTMILGVSHEKHHDSNQAPEKSDYDCESFRHSSLRIIIVSDDPCTPVYNFLES